MKQEWTVSGSVLRWRGVSLRYSARNVTVCAALLLLALVMGCYAMTDTVMDEIYQYAELALKNGQQSINIHIFPFKMTDENMKKF